jgi:uncharacterized membrane protein
VNCERQCGYDSTARAERYVGCTVTSAVSSSDPDHATPEGWSYDPSSWSQRLPIVALALLGFLIASYLALYQWRVVGHVWEPFFGAGSEKVLGSWLSRVLPIPDAALGACGYLLDAIAGLIGGRGRWRSRPWVVLVLGLLVGPLGAISVLLVILQPIAFHAWCTLCLASAAISVLMIGPALDEVLASLQYLRRESRAGRSVWRAFLGKEDSWQPASSRPSSAFG